MKPVFQKRAEDNACFSACLASILEIGLADVPNFFNRSLRKVKELEKKSGKTVEHLEIFWPMVGRWLAKRGLQIMPMIIVNDGQLQGFFSGSFYCIVSYLSKSNKNEEKFGVHSLVGCACENTIGIVHDPMPVSDREKYNVRLYPFPSNMPGKQHQYAYFLVPKLITQKG